MSSQKRDYDEVGGVSRTADDAELKKAYRRMAMEFHPDRRPGDKEAEEKFKEAKEAYEMLSDPKKREAYDRFGHAGVDPNAAGMGGGGGAVREPIGAPDQERQANDKGGRSKNHGELGNI